MGMSCLDGNVRKWTSRLGHDALWEKKAKNKIVHDTCARGVMELDTATRVQILD